LFNKHEMLPKNASCVKHVMSFFSIALSLQLYCVQTICTPCVILLNCLNDGQDTLFSSTE